MKFNHLFVLLLLSFSGIAQNEIVIGETSTMYSEILKEDRKLDIHLPEGYGESDKTYPILFLLDSDYNFKHAVGTLEYLYKNRRIPQMIIVGIRNTRRNRDLSPQSSRLSQEERDRMGLVGGADNFRKFIQMELMPHINKNYKAAPYEVIVGHSLGGLFNTYCFFNHPDIFNAYVTISPSLWYPNKFISQDFDEAIKEPSKVSATFYMTLANENKGTMRGDVLKLSGKFHNYINAHPEADLRFKYEPMPEESHGSIGLPSIYHGLSYIFEPIKYEIPQSREEIMAQGGPEEAISKTVEYFNKLSEKYGFEVTNEYALIDLGYAFLRVDEFREDSVKAFKLNVEEHPESYDAFSTLGMAFEELGDYEKAKLNYKKAYDMVMEDDNFEWEFYKADLDRVEKKLEEEATPAE